MVQRQSLETYKYTEREERWLETFEESEVQAFHMIFNYPVIDFICGIKEEIFYKKRKSV